MKKSFFSVVIALLTVFSFSANAQLSTGTPSSRHFNLGNRAKAGDNGFYIAAVAQGDGESMSFQNLTVTPMINFKHMATDNAELRMSLEWYGNKEKAKGDIITEDSKELDFNGKYSNSHFVLYPGIVWHFANTNILDVYGGVEGLVGRIANAYTETSSYNQSSSTQQKSSFNYGLGAVVGIQHYIWKLPVSLGVEYSIIAKKETGIKYKYEAVDSEGKSETFFTLDAHEFENLSFSSSQRFNSLSASKSMIFNQLRLTLTYYFN